MNYLKEPDHTKLVWQASNINERQLSIVDIRSANISLNWRTILTYSKLVALFFLDVLMIFSSWLVAGAISTPFAGLPNDNYVPVVLAMSIGTLAASGFYTTDDQRHRLTKLLRSLMLAQVVVCAASALRQPEYWMLHPVFLISLPLNFLFVGGARLLLHRSIIQIRKHNPVLQEPIVLMGHRNDTDRVNKLLNRSRQFRVDSVIDLSIWDIEKQLDQIVRQIRSRKVSEVFVCSPHSIDNEALLLWKLKAAGVHLRIVPVELQLPQRSAQTKMIEEIHTIRFNSLPFVGVNFWLKRCLDLVASCLTLLLISPLLLLIAISIKATSSGPIFYKQDRVGLKGRRFQVWKFRTMVENASELQSELEAQNEIKGGVLFKIKKDPRITRVGKFLRDYSLDELPQLINVLQGQMSLVGPRPLAIRDYELSLQNAGEFSKESFLRYEVLPGITGLWQVKGRKSINSADEIFYWDMVYILQWSLALDFKIIIETVKVVLFKEGAC